MSTSIIESGKAVLNAASAVITQQELVARINQASLASLSLQEVKKTLQQMVHIDVTKLDVSQLMSQQEAVSNLMTDLCEHSTEFLSQLSADVAAFEDFLVEELCEGLAQNVVEIQARIDGVIDQIMAIHQEINDACEQSTELWCELSEFDMQRHADWHNLSREWNELSDVEQIVRMAPQHAKNWTSDEWTSWLDRHPEVFEGVSSSFFRETAADQIMEQLPKGDLTARLNFAQQEMDWVHGQMSTTALKYMEIDAVMWSLFDRAAELEQQLSGS